MTDYLFRWLELRFLKGEQGLLFELPKPAQPKREVTSAIEGLGRSQSWETRPRANVHCDLSNCAGKPQC